MKKPAFFALAATAIALFSAFSGALSIEQELDLLAGKTQAKLNEYYETHEVKFDKTAGGPYRNVFYYTAAYWKKNGVLVGTFQINVKRPFTLLSIGKTINGVRVQFSNNPDRILMNFDCTRPSNKNSKYRVSTDAYPQFASRDELAGALTVACAEFQNAVRETQKTQQMKQAGNGGA